jgi:hypothetical protein
MGSEAFAAAPTIDFDHRFEGAHSAAESIDLHCRD